MLDRQTRGPSTSDRELIARTAEGDRGAFTQLVERHAAAVLRLTSALSRNRAEAEDALQQAFLNAYQAASGYRGDGSVRTWLLTIARNATYRFRVRNGREDLVEEPLMSLGLEAGWGSPNPEAIAIAAERRSVLRTAISQLSPSDQEVLVLRDLEGLDGSEAAEVLGISERAMKSRLHRARLRLAVSLRGLVADSTGGQEGGQP
jgi:RNA polymerase sigma-70 factor (ECF subfamily)